MSISLVIRLPATEDALYEWVHISAAEKGVGARVTGTLDELAAAARGSNAIVLAPAADVLRIRIAIPLKGAAKIRQALPFALEEQLATDVEGQHFAFSKRDAADLVPVAVVAQPLLAGWLATLQQAGITPTAVYSAIDALPATPATITVLIDRNQAIIQVPTGDPTVVDEISLQAVLDLILEKQERELANNAAVVPVNLLVYCDEAKHEQYHVLWERLRLKVEHLDVKLLPDGALQLLAGNILAGGGVNLLQGSFARKSDIPIQWRQWRIAALLLAGLLVLNLAVKGAELWRLSQANAALDSAATQVLTQTFPDANATQDPWGTLRSLLGAGSSEESISEAGFNEILEILATGFAQTPAIKMDSISYRSGELDLQLIAPDVSTLDQLSRLIAETGQFTAEIQSANPDEKVIKGRMRITAKEPG